MPFPSVARMRSALLACATFLPLVAAATSQDVLFTSSVSYCKPPTSVLIERFNIAYFASNGSISFDISAATQEAMKVSANIAFNVYGQQPVNVSIDVCSILGHALCPLPAYNFTGADSITLPSTVDVASRLPGIAYKIPDLEAFAQLTITDTETNEVVACVQATLSNGWSARQTAAEWATAGVAFLALLAAFIHTSNPLSLASTRLLDVMFLFQSIAASGLLALNFPSVYRAFTLNFAWSLGLLRSPGIQKSINSMRSHTGGSVSTSSGNAVGLTDRGLSPYNMASIMQSAGSATGSFLSSVHALIAAPFASSRIAMQSSQGAVTGQNFAGLYSSGEVQTVTSTSSNVLQAGIPIYVNSLGIDTASTFMTVFIMALIFLAISIGVFLVVFGTLYFLSGKSTTMPRVHDLKDRMPLYTRAWGLRIALIMLLPVATFAFYQWTLHDSWASVLLSVLFLFVVLAAVAIPSFLAIRTARREGPDALHAHSSQLIAHGPLHAAYRPSRWYTSLVFVALLLLRSIFIAFAKSNAMVQVVLLLATEALFFVALCVLKPHPTRGADVFAGYLSLTRVVATGLLVAFVPALGVRPIPRVAIGLVVILLYAVATIVTFVNVTIHLLGPLFRRSSAIPRRQASDMTLVDEKNAGKEKTQRPASGATWSSGLTPFADTPTSSSFHDPESRHSTHSLAPSASDPDPFSRDRRSAVV